MSEDEHWIVNGFADGTVLVFDAWAETTLHIIRLDPPSGVGRLTVSRDGKWVAMRSSDTMVREVAVVTGKCIQVVRGLRDNSVIADGAPAFPLRMLARGLETVIEDAATDREIAWFPIGLEHIKTHASKTR